jgi:heterodisulfide reductase subunit A-like polyferredoxin/coenzyme F420-reducing hydrogenase delta subunit
MKGSRSLQVFLCHGHGTLDEAIDFDRLREVAATLPGVNAVVDAGALCTDLNGDFAASCSRGAVGGVVVVGCAEDRLVNHVRSLAVSAGEPDLPLATADLKWVLGNGATGEAVTPRAEALLRQAVAQVAAAAEPVHDVIASENRVLVLGEGTAALRATSELSQAGYPVTMVTRQRVVGRSPLAASLSAESQRELDELVYAALNHEGVEVLTQTDVVEVGGGAGQFELRLRKAGRADFLRPAGALVVATEPLLRPRSTEYGLELGGSVVTQQTLERRLASASERDWAGLPEESSSVVFLLGLKSEPLVVDCQRALRAALQLAPHRQVFVVTSQLRVAGPGVEVLAQQCRRQGVTILKVATGSPVTVTPVAEQVEVSFPCDALDQETRLSADLVVVDEAMEPPPSLKAVAAGLRLEMGPAGGIQPDNVHLAPVLSSHQAVYVVGPARGVHELEATLGDADAAVLEIRQRIPREPTSQPRSVQAQVDPEKCASCLTCLRVCPHGAVNFTDRPVIASQFCEGCGQCASECPRQAITLRPSSDQAIVEQVRAAATGWCQPGKESFIVAFCCRRSAVEAVRLAQHQHQPLPAGLMVVELPCAGRTNEAHVLGAFEAGADGVMVLGCHHGNCRSIHGNERARQRVKAARGRLEAIGLEPRRLVFETVAANMAVEVASLVQGFELELAGLGPSPLRAPRSQASQFGSVGRSRKAAPSSAQERSKA